MSDPKHIVVAGDWHGNLAWAFGVVRRLPELLPDEQPRIVLHCGDFGIWPGPPGQRYLRNLDRELEDAGAVLWFVDGNHEDHDALAVLPDTPTGHGWVSDRIFHLRRGQRWTWHGRVWMALGGAVSVDRSCRVEGRSWWPQEAITVEQAHEVIHGGRADVMLTHDCPGSVLHDFPPPPSWWDPDDLQRAAEHRALLQIVVNSVQPAHLIHGHLHKSYQLDAVMAHGRVQVTGMDCDGGEGNWAVLDAASMTWQTKEMLRGEQG